MLLMGKLSKLLSRKRFYSKRGKLQLEMKETSDKGIRFEGCPAQPWSKESPFLQF